MKTTAKYIDIICVISITSSILLAVISIIYGLNHNGKIKFISILGFSPWPVEWIIINIPVMIFGGPWLSMRYGKLLKTRFPYLFGPYAFALLGIALVLVQVLRFFLRG